MILDKETSKGKFLTGVIDSVKVDSDQQVRKVIVKYKLRSQIDHFPSVFKYTERNVRGLALLVKAEERSEIEDIDLDEVRFANIPADEDNEVNDNNSDGNDEDRNEVNDAATVRDDHNITSEEEIIEEDQQNEAIDEESDIEEIARNSSEHEEESDNSEDDSGNNNKKTRILDPSSSGRRRWIPAKYV